MRQGTLLGFASILIVFIGIGVGILWLFSRIGGALDVAVVDSQRWVLTDKAMMEALNSCKNDLVSGPSSMLVW
jgi:hypothetical protein